MSTPDQPNAIAGRWEHLIEIAFKLSETLDELEKKHGPGSEAALAATRLYMDDLIEVFGGDLDPVDHLPEFAVRRLAMVLHRAAVAPSSGSRKRRRKKGRRKA